MPPNGWLLPLMPSAMLKRRATFVAGGHDVIDLHQAGRRAHVERHVAGFDREPCGIENLRRRAEHHRQKRMRHRRAIVDRHRGAVANRQDARTRRRRTCGFFFNGTAERAAELLLFERRLRQPDRRSRRIEIIEISAAVQRAIAVEAERVCGDAIAFRSG